MALSWPAFGMMLIGVVVGFVVGILPGIGLLATLVIMIPFTFGMEPGSAVALLLGLYSVTATTGDLTTILVGIPGETASTPLLADGFPMTKKGQAGRAMGAALASSLVGAVVGAGGLFFSVPIIRPLVLSFGSPEFFMLTLLGITFITALSSQSLLKGLLSGGLGLLMATIGYHGMSGQLRYTFSLFYLYEGIPLISAVIGLFALPEVIDLARVKTFKTTDQMKKISGAMEGVMDTFRHLWLVIRCSLLGMFLGLLPGMGSSTAGWMAYGHAIQTSDDKSKFGKGCIEGVLAPGAANNSREGGALIPTIAFGVPGSSGMAVLLGALLIVGLTPGPDMLTKNLNLTYLMVWTIVIANIITVLAALPILNYLAKLASVRGSLLAPVILCFAFLGAFTEANIGDLITLVVFGALGYAMRLYGWSRPALVLGMVLGRSSEKYLNTSVARYGAAWLLKPAVLVLLCIVFGNIVYTAIRKKGKATK